MNLPPIFAPISDNPSLAKIQKRRLKLLADLEEREAMEHYESLVAIAQNISSEPPRLLMELAAMRPGPIEKAFRAPKRLGLKAVRWIDRRLLKYLEVGNYRPSRPVSPQDHRVARQGPAQGYQQQETPAKCVARRPQPSARLCGLGCRSLYPPRSRPHH